MSDMNLTDHFLIAMPSLNDTLFSGSLIYLCEHSENGAMGLIINKPSPVPMDVVFAGTGKATPLRFHEQFVMMGGPIQTERGFVLHTPVGDWQNSMAVTGDIALTTSRDIIDGLQSDGQVAGAMVSIGYAGWSAGQLEQEIAQNSWLAVSADRQILFQMPPEQRYRAAFAKLGLRPEQLMEGMGYA